MDKRISRKYFNEHAACWDEMVKTNNPQKLRALAERLSISKESWVLDVGTGTGVFIPYIQKSVNHSGKIFSMDYALNMLSVARQKNGKGNVCYVCAEIESLRFSKSIFDVVVCYSTFPHFHDKQRALSNIYELLKPSGWIYICHTASREHINSIHQAISDLKDHLLPEREEMTKLLECAGFQQILVEELRDSYLACGTKEILTG